MQNALKSNQNCVGHIKQQISLVIIRLEIDDLNLKTSPQRQSFESPETTNKHIFTTKSSFLKDLDNDSATSSKAAINCSNKNIHDIFSYNSSTLESERDNDLLLKDYSERFESKEEALKIFIGKRESQLISIETYYFDTKTSTKSMYHNNNLNQTNQLLVTNAMTMQKALETAYNDWNKDKLKSDITENNDSTQQETSQPIPIENIKHLEQTTESPTLSSSLPTINDFKSDEIVIKKSNKLKNKQQLINKAKQQKSLDEISKIDNDSKTTFDGACSSSSVSSIVPSTTEIAYFYGNPTVDLVKGFIHIYKDWLVFPFKLSFIKAYFNRFNTQ